MNSINSKIILGTVQFGLNYGINNQNGKPTQEEVNKILNFASEHGIDKIDTANAYGDSEKVLGNYINQNKKKFKVLSKFNTTENVNTILEETLQRLNTSKLFCFSFHNYKFFKENNSNTFKQLINLKSKGVIENIGISLYTNQELKEAIALDYIDIIQVPFNILDNDKEKQDLFIEAKNKNKSIHVRSVFLQGLFLKNPETLSGKLTELKKELVLFNNIANENNISIESMALSYVMSKTSINNVLIGVDNLQQLKNNLNSIIKLDIELIKKIETIKVINKILLNPSNW